MTAREAARQHAVTIERLAAEVRTAPDPYAAAKLVDSLRQETRHLSDAMNEARAEKRPQAAP